ncbi:MAG: hypothetical protein BWX47_01349 [candidate division Hyd24-12 bacterium ADurb.Bin004]|nr:MAG: hypothetical protein BWX47_01349 [candidate division Hyd24-12 bacterium ADurb.Bin004]
MPREKRMPDRSIPSKCPSCSRPLLVTKLVCPDCGSEVVGEFDPCPVCRLDDGLRQVFDAFLDARGNLREVQKVLGVSYPTARLRVEEVFRALDDSGRNEAGKRDALKVLARLRSGEIGLDDAERLLGEGG